MGIGVPPRYLPPPEKILQRNKDGTYSEVTVAPGEVHLKLARKVMETSTSKSGVPLLNGKPLKIK